MRSGQGAKLNFSFVKLEKDHCEGRWARGAPWGLKPSQGGVYSGQHTFGSRSSVPSVHQSGETGGWQMGGVVLGWSGELLEKRSFPFLPS